MKLDKQQLVQLKDFVSSRGFSYYDLQLEIIDHMACKVEELMAADSTLTLDAAISKAHGEFGVMGFSVFEDHMCRSLQKKYARLFKQTFISYFKPVYLPLMAGFIYLIYILCIAANAPFTFFNATWVVVFVLLLVNAIAEHSNKQRYKRMLTAQMGNTIMIILNAALQLFNLWNILAKDRVQLNAGLAGIAIGVFLTIAIICFFTLRQMQKTILKNCCELEEMYDLTVGLSYKL